jgi:hypothetical protein
VKSVNETTHAFIVRIWIEPRDLKEAEPVWRGVIEHVEGEKHVYFNSLDKMRRYFSDYLEDLGIKILNRER